MLVCLELTNSLCDLDPARCEAYLLPTTPSIHYSPPLHGLRTCSSVSLRQQESFIQPPEVTIILTQKLSDINSQHTRHLRGSNYARKSLSLPLQYTGLLSFPRVKDESVSCRLFLLYPFPADIRLSDSVEALNLKLNSSLCVNFVLFVIYS